MAISKKQKIREELKLAIGEKIKEQRLARNISQTDLAKSSRISRASIVNIELGRQMPPIDTLAKIADILQVNISVLIPYTAVKTYQQDSYPTFNVKRELAMRELDQIPTAHLRALLNLYKRIKK